MALDEAAFGENPEFRPASRGKFRFLTLPFRFSFRLFKRSLAGVIRTLAYHPVSSLLVVVLVAAVAFLSIQDFSSPHAAAGADSGNVPRSAAAENFIKGQTTFDASLMWNSFSDSFKQQLASKGTSQQSLQQQLNQRKQSGVKVEDVQYGGGVPEPDGSRAFFYVLTLDAPNNQGVAETHYVLTVDPSDKIVNVE